MAPSLEIFRTFARKKQAMSYEIRPLQLKILDILVAVDKVCREHGLTYYIVCGTLIGAVRHKGFIPWDDDLDITMPRPDYDRLMAHAHEWMPQPYEVVSYETDPEHYPLPFGKVQDASTTLIERMHLKYLGGIYLDVFPLDGMTKNPIKQWIHFTRYFYYKKVIYFLHRDPYRHGHGPSSWIPLLCRHLYTLQGVQARMKQLQQQYSYATSPLCVEHDKARKSVVPKEVYGTPTPIEFEGRQFFGPSQPEVYLEHVYGDYMTIPPADKIKQHLFHYLDLEHPYREYNL